MARAAPGDLVFFLIFLPLGARSSALESDRMYVAEPADG